MKSQQPFSLFAALFLILIVTPAYAGEITYPDDSYISGDTLMADDLNTKLNDIKAQVNDINTLKAVAYGKVRFDGTLGFGPYNITSTSWNAVLSRYEIDITGVYYSISNTTTATVAGDAGSCPGGASARQSSVGGLLLIYVLDQSGTKIQCSFDFVSYAGP